MIVRTGRRLRGFTLLELLVVIGIIVIMTALSIPAISKFLDGQQLTQSGRIVQSAFNEARRAAITQRSRNYLVFFREPDDSKPGEFLYGMRRYRDRVGYEGESHYLLPGAMFDLSTNTVTVAGVAAELSGLPIPLFDGLPDDTQAPIFTPGRSVQDTVSWVRFLRDGTIELDGPSTMVDKVPYTIGGDSIFDLNVQFNDIAVTDFDTIAPLVDLSLREAIGAANTDKRCFIDIDHNTGRVRFRVLQVTDQ